MTAIQLGTASLLLSSGDVVQIEYDPNYAHSVFAVFTSTGKFLITEPHFQMQFLKDINYCKEVRKYEDVFVKLP